MNTVGLAPFTCRAPEGAVVPIPTELAPPSTKNICVLPFDSTLKSLSPLSSLKVAAPATTRSLYNSTLESLAINLEPPPVLNFISSVPNSIVLFVSPMCSILSANDIIANEAVEVEEPLIRFPLNSCTSSEELPNCVEPLVNNMEADSNSV